MKRSIKQLILTAPAALMLLAPAAINGVVSAETPPTATNSQSSAATTEKSGDAQATRLANIKTKGDAEINRRLTTLNNLLSKISGASKLSASDKSALTAEANTEITGLTTLKTKLAGETTVAAAAADVSSMITEYRVYALVVPEVQLVRVADDQQVVEDRLNTLYTKLQTRVTAAQTAGKNVSALQASLADMQSKTTAAQTISSSVESKVLTLQPADYNADHTLLAGYRDQLKTAHSDNEAAYNEAKSIVSALKNL